MYLSCGILVYTGKGKTCLPMRGLRYRTGKLNKPILWGVLNMIKWRMRDSWGFKGCGRWCPQTFFYQSSSFLSLCFTEYQRSPFFCKERRVLPSGTSHTISGAEFNYTHILLLIFLLLIIKVPVNQKKEKLAKNEKYLKLIVKAY